MEETQIKLTSLSNSYKKTAYLFLGVILILFICLSGFIYYILSPNRIIPARTEQIQEVLIFTLRTPTEDYPPFDLDVIGNDCLELFQRNMRYYGTSTIKIYEGLYQQHEPTWGFGDDWQNALVTFANHETAILKFYKGQIANCRVIPNTDETSMNAQAKLY